MAMSQNVLPTIADMYQSWFIMAKIFSLNAILV